MEALSCLGCHQAALATQQARGGGLGFSPTPSGDTTAQGLSVQQATAALRVYLECGGVSEAFLEVGSLVARF